MSLTRAQTDQQQQLDELNLITNSHLCQLDELNVITNSHLTQVRAVDF